MKKSQSNAKQEHRAGVAAVELAVCLPIILVLILGTLQACSMFYLKQNLGVAAYEGIRRCVEYNSTPDQVEAACLQILQDRRVIDGTVEISPANYETLPPQTWITITVTAPSNSNSPLRGWVYADRSLTASATMMKEF